MVQVKVFKWENGQWDQSFDQTSLRGEVCLLCFGERYVLEKPEILQSIQDQFGKHETVFCSTSGEIYNSRIYDHTLIVACMEFKKTSIQTAMVNINSFENAVEAGKALIGRFPEKDLAGILVFSDGHDVNGSQLVQGMNAVYKEKVLITGGLAGDGDRFKKTITGLNDILGSGNIVAVGFYGNKLKIGHGSLSGWDFFGPERAVTRSENNILYEIGGKNALENYKHYLGEEANFLPASALLFPLSVRLPGADIPVVRTILDINEKDKSLIFAGDIPEGSYVRFMKANLNKLPQAAEEAATIACNTLGHDNIDFALVISCVGRKIVLGAKCEDEIEAILNIMHERTAVCGYYSYGEISPFNNETKCQLHNQTVTITTFYEA